MKQSTYESIFDLNNVTLEDCEVMYKCKNECAVIRDGMLKDFTKEKSEVVLSR